MRLQKQSFTFGLVILLTSMLMPISTFAQNTKADYADISTLEIGVSHENWQVENVPGLDLATGSSWGFVFETMHKGRLSDQWSMWFGVKGIAAQPTFNIDHSQGELPVFDLEGQMPGKLKMEVGQVKMPLYVRYQFSPGFPSFFLESGPEGGYIASATYGYTGGAKSVNYDMKKQDKVNNFQFGWGLNGGYAFLWEDTYWEAGLSASYQATPLLDVQEDARFRPLSVALSLGFNF